MNDFYSNCNTFLYMTYTNSDTSLNIQSVHFAGLLDVQNILSIDTVVSPCKLKVIHTVITWSVSQSVLRHRVL
jgi:hypothetical protein